MKIKILVIIITAITLTNCNKNKTEELSNEQLAQLTEEAYIYALPVIMSYKTMYMYSVDKSSSQFKAPFNHIKNTHRVYGPKDVAVISANSDTPYSLLWMDLRTEPFVLTVPKIEKSRYFSVMNQDLSTYVLPYIGSRVTGNDGGSFLIALSGWKGNLPKGIDKKIPSTSDFAFSVFRTQLINNDDMDHVIAIQNGYKVQPLSEYLGKEAPAAAPAIDFIPWNEKEATGTDFIKYLNFLLQFISPDDVESKLLQKLAPLGIGAGKDFDFSKLEENMKKSITTGVTSGIAKIKKRSETLALAGHTQKDYNHDWLLRASVTQMGWGANDPKEASYPILQVDDKKEALDASKNNYTITFKKGKFPPVNSFWSITLYDGATQLMIDNPLNRYLLNSPMLPDMVLNEDGSLTLYLQNKTPGKDKEANWLPAPKGKFYILLRLYWPKDEFLNGAWKVPSVIVNK